MAQPPRAAPGRVARLRLEATAPAIRVALRQLRAAPQLHRLAEPTRDRVELILAEVLNNIARHAYAAAPGEIEVTLCCGAGGLRCAVTDRGLPMPSGALPQGLPPRLEMGHPLPEGGFGWFLIRSQAEGLRYRRTGNRNRLSFRVATEQSTP